MENIALDTNSNLTINVKPIVKVTTTISIMGTNIELPIDITADFTNIPPHLHGIYLSTLNDRYNSDINIWDSTGDMTPEPKTIEESKSEWRLNRLTDIFQRH